jgi:hypothetical protein
VLDKVRADKVALALAILAALISAAIVSTHGPELGAPTKTTVIVEAASGGGVPKKIRRTTEVGPRSFFERVLGDGGIVLLQIGAVLLVAFLTGAFAQRLLMGDFALKLGPLELSTLQEGTERTVLDLTAQVATLSEAEAKRTRDLESVTKQVADSSNGLIVVGGIVSELREKITELERRSEKRDGN